MEEKKERLIDGTGCLPYKIYLFSPFTVLIDAINHVESLVGAMVFEPASTVKELGLKDEPLARSTGYFSNDVVARAGDVSIPCTYHY